MTYRYRLTIYEKASGIKLKGFWGNDTNEMYERFEMWFIKSNFTGTREDLFIHMDYVQHANN